MIRYTVVLLALLLLAGSAGCVTQNTHIGRVEAKKPVKRSVYSYTLPNGVRVVVKNGADAGPTAVQLWVSDGGMQDPAGKPGIGHFVEHMLFCGSEKYPPGSAENIIEGMGGKLTGDTGKDFCYIGVRLPGPGWEKAVDVMYDMAVHPAFLPKQVDMQRKVVGLELSERARDTDTALMDGFFRQAYLRHPYGSQVTGDIAAVGSLTREDAVDYHGSTYVPSAMTLVVVGAASPASVKAAADRTFGTIPEVPVKKQVPVDEPGQISVREKEARMPVGLAYMAVGWRICSASEKDIYALEVIRAVLGLGEGSRLPVELKDKKSVLLDVGSELFALREPGVLVIKAKLEDDNVTRAREEILKQAQRLKDGTVSGDELRRAVRCIETEQLRSTDTVEGQAYAIGYFETVYKGTDPGEFMENVRKVSPQDIRRVAQTYLGEGNYTIAVIRPESHD